MYSKKNFIRESIESKNFDDIMQKLNQRIIMKENVLQEQITENHKDIISICSSIANINLSNLNILRINQTLTDFILSLVVKVKEQKENEDVLKRVNEINSYIFDLFNILKTTQETPERLPDYFYVVKKLQDNIQNVKKFKAFIFYDTLKEMIKRKKQSIIISLKKKTDEWLGDMLKKYKDIGERITNNEIILRKELDLQTILVSLYINEKLDHSNEFFDYFNSKRKNIFENIRIFETIGFLYAEKILTDKNHKFKIEIYRDDFEKNDLTFFIKFLRKYNFDSSKQEEKLEKMCCDFIFEQIELVKEKDDIERYKNECLDYLKDVDRPCVYEIFYKSLDDLYVKHINEFTYVELNEKLKDLENKRADIAYDFKTSEHLKEIENNLIKKIDKIFEKEEFTEIYSPDIFLTEKIVIYIRDKFIEKVKSKKKLEERKVEGEIVKFYVHLNSIDEKLGKLFHLAVEISKHQK